jgi:hypothetical protein
MKKTQSNNINFINYILFDAKFTEIYTLHK